MTKQKATFQAPSYVPHIPHDSQLGWSDDPQSVLPLALLTPMVAQSTVSGIEWNVISVDWSESDAAEVSDEGHYLTSVSYNVKSAGSSTRSQQSKTVTVNAKPTYDVWYRFCTIALPNQKVVDESSSDWKFLMTVDEPRVPEKTYKPETTGTYSHVQFAICGRDKGFKPFYNDAGNDSESLTGDGVFSESGATWIRNHRDNQVLVVSSPQRVQGIV